MLVAPPIEKYLENEKNLKQIVDDLANELENAEKIGSNVHIDDSAKFDCKIIPYGNKEQETRAGYNKLPIVFSSAIKNEVTLTVQKNGTMLLNGTATADTVFDATFLSEISLENYIFKLVQKAGTISSGSIQFFLFTSGYSANQNIALTPNISNVQATLNSNSYAIERIVIPSGTVLNNVEIYSMISEIEKEYEQYGAMPSLKFECPVKHVGGSYKSYNLFNKETITNGFINADGGVSAGDDIGYSDFISVIPGEVYNFGNRGEWQSVALYDNNKNFIERATIPKGDYIIPSTTYYVITNLPQNHLDVFQLTKGSGEKRYLPYGEVNSVYDITKVNKNEFDKNYVLDNYAFTSVVGSKTTKNSNANTFLLDKKLKTKNSNVTISSLKTNAVLKVIYVDENDIVLNSKAISSLPITIDMSEYDYFRIFFDKTTISLEDDIQIEYGEYKTNYIAHQEENHFLDLTKYPIYNGCPCKKGDKWIIYDKETKIVLDGTKLFTLGNPGNRYYLDIELNNKNYFAESNYFKSGEENNFNVMNTVVLQSNRINLMTDEFDSVDELNAKILELYNAGTPIYIVYETLEPTEIEITDKAVVKVLEALYNNETYKGVTNISTEKNLQDAADLILKIEYKKSNQVKIKELEKEIENLKALILEA